MPERAARLRAEPGFTADDPQRDRLTVVRDTREPAVRAVRRAPGRDAHAPAVQEPRPRAAAEPRTTGRRTIVITGHVVDRYAPPRSRQRRTALASPYYGGRSRPDRAAMWAVLLGFLLVAVALASAGL